MYITAPRSRSTRPVARGLGAISLTDIWNIIAPPAEQVVEDVKDSVIGGGANVVDQILQSSQFKVVLDKVQDAAEKGVAEKVKENAPALMGLAIAGGAIGGAVFRGPIGVVAAGAIAVGAGYKLLTSVAPPPPPATKPPVKR